MTEQNHQEHRGSLFISYSDKDRQRVLGLAELLGALGFEVFFAARSIVPGKRWREEIELFLNRCDYLVVFWSRNAQASAWVQREVQLALGRSEDCTLVPVLADETRLPEELAEIQAVEGIGIVNELLLLSRTLEKEGVAQREVESAIRRRLRQSGIFLDGNQRAKVLGFLVEGSLKTSVGWLGLGLYSSTMFSALSTIFSAKGATVLLIGATTTTAGGALVASGTMQSIQRNESTIAVQSSEVENLESTLAQLESKLDAEVALLQGELAAFSERYVDSEEYSEEIGELKAETEELLEGLRQSTTGLDGRIGELDLEAAKISSFVERLTEVDASQRKTLGDFKKRMDGLSTLVGELSENLQGMSVLTEETANLRKNSKDLEEQVASLQSDLNDLNRQYEDIGLSRHRIELGKSGSETCQGLGLACMGLTSKRVGHPRTKKFWGYTSFSCNSRVVERPGCAGTREWAIDGAEFKKSPDSTVEEDSSSEHFCISKPYFDFVICSSR